MFYSEDHGVFDTCYSYMKEMLDYLIEEDEGLTVQTNDMLGDSLSDTGVLGVMILVMLAAMIYSRYKMELTKNLIRTTARIINYTALTKKELDQLQECLTSTNTLVNEVEETHMDVRHKLQKISLEMSQLNGKLHLMHAICVKGEPALHEIAESVEATG